MMLPNLRAHHHYQINDVEMCKHALFQPKLLQSGQWVIYTVLTKLTISQELDIQIEWEQMHVIEN